jgi:hypothetical protein
MKKPANVIILLLIYAVTLSVRIYWFTQKDAFHIDEGLSITLACYNEYMWTSNYEFNREYTGKEVKEASLCDDDSVKSVFKDIYRLWKDNRDPPHTNFYYSLLRLSLAGLKTGNINDIIFRAAILNIILCTISFFFFYFLLNLLFTGNKILVLSAVFWAFLSTASVSNALFFRPYQLQETLFIIFAYFFAKSMNRQKYVISGNELYLNFPVTLGMAFIAALTLLTGYYAIFFIGVFGLYVLYINIRIKNIKEIQAYAVILMAALIFAQLFYPLYIFGFLSYRASETVRTVFANGFFGNTAASAVCIITILKDHFFTVPVIVLCAALAVCLLLQKQKIIFDKLALLLLLTSFIYTVIVTFTAPLKILRYSMPVFPFFVFLPAILIYSIKNKYISNIAILLFCVLSFINLFSGRIENLYKNKPMQYLFNEDKNIPVFVVNKKSWAYADMVPYFNDEQKYFFYDDFDDVRVDDKYNEIYFVTETSDLRNIVLPDYEVESKSESDFFICRKLIKNPRAKAAKQ